MDKKKTYVDSHAHILSEEFQADLSEVEQRAADAGVEKILLVTTSASEAYRGMEFCGKNPERYALAYGIHPEDADLADEKVWDEFVRIAHDERIAAIGEIGLDFYWRKDNRDKQIDLFIRQIEIAKEVNKPILVHSRDAIQDTYDIMKEHRCRGVMHCYSGSPEMALEFTKLGYLLAFGGALTFKNSKRAKESASAIKQEYLLTETDCPYMAPVPVRGTRNEPANIPYIEKELAAVRGEDADVLASAIIDNYAYLLTGVRNG